MHCVAQGGHIEEITTKYDHNSMTMASCGQCSIYNGMYFASDGKEYIEAMKLLKEWGGDIEQGSIVSIFIFWLQTMISYLLILFFFVISMNTIDTLHTILL